MSGQLILSGKPFNTFSMARLNILQLRLTLTLLFTTTKDPTTVYKSLLPCMACIFFLSHYISVIGVFFFILVTLLLCLLLIYRYLWNFQKWQILISVNRELDFLHFQRFVTRTPNPPLKKKVFVYGKGVQNTCTGRSKFTNIFFFNFHLYFRRHLPLMPPS
jgi:hypothetical protein